MNAPDLDPDLGPGLESGPELAPQLDGSTATSPFGTFYLRDAEFGLHARHIREVVPYPEEVTPIPLAGSFVDGLFTLRGEVLPIVDLAGLLGVDSGRREEGRRVAIVEDGGVCIGVALDRTGELVRAGDATLRRIDADDEGDAAIVNGMICLDEGKRLIQTLSARAISLASGLPESALGRSVDETPPAVRTFSKAIVVRVGEMELAFDIHEVREICGEADLDESPRYFDHCAGVIKLRDHDFAVMDLREALGLEADPATGRLLFVEHEGLSIGLIVDALVETLEYPDDELHPVPDLLADGAAALCRSLILPSPTRHVLQVDVERLFERHHVSQVRQLLDSSSEWFDDSRIDDGEELGFFAFRVGEQTLCVPLEKVREVQEIGEDVIRTGGARRSGASYLNLRGDLVPLVESRMLLGVENQPPPERPLALVMEDGDRAYGLVVDAIVDIKRMRSSKVAECGPGFARQVNGAKLGSLLDRALVVDRGEDPSEVLLVLCPTEVLKARQADTDGPSSAEAA